MDKLEWNIWKSGNANLRSGVRRPAEEYPRSEVEGGLWEPGLAGPGCWRTAGALVSATPSKEKLRARVLGSAPGRPRIRETAPAMKGVDRGSGEHAMSPDMVLYWACSVLSLSPALWAL